MHIRPCLSRLPAALKGELVLLHVSCGMRDVFGKCAVLALSSQFALVLLLPLWPPYADSRSFLSCYILGVAILWLLDLALRL